MNYGLILAAGSGRRFGGEKPKQFQKLCGEKICSYSIREFEKSARVEGYGILTTPDQKDELLAILADFDKNKCEFIANGGKTRRESVFIGLNELKEFSPRSVLVHDAARPAINQSLLERIYQRFKADRSDKIVGVIPVRPVRDTIKKVDKKGYVLETVNREQLRRVQTPQLFDFEKLYKAHQSCPADLPVTDDAMLLEMCKEPVAVVDGLEENQKITYPADRHLVERFIKRRKENV